MRTVKNILDIKSKFSNVIEPKVLVIEALKKLNEYNLSYLIVMDGDNFKGIFSERDYSRNLILKGRSSRDTMVDEVMTTDLPVVYLDNSVEDCMYKMNTQGARYLLAYDNQEFVGVITIHDLLRQVIANRELVFDYTLTNQLLDNDESCRIY